MSQKIASIALAIALSCLAPTLHAQAVWQCSRIQVDDEALSESEKDDSFSIASMSAAVDVINLSLRDLADVYSGRPVRVGGLPLTACFMSIDHPLTVSALETLGLNASVLKTWDAFWQKLFLTVGIVVAVFGMRLLFPLLIVAIATGLGLGRSAAAGPGQCREQFPHGFAAMGVAAGAGAVVAPGRPASTAAADGAGFMVAADAPA